MVLHWTTVKAIFRGLIFEPLPDKHSKIETVNKFSLWWTIFKVYMTRNFLFTYSKELSKWWKMAFTYCDSTFGLGKLDDLWRHIVDKMMYIHKKMEYLWRRVLYSTETLCSCCTHHKVSWYFHCDISMATQWAPGPLHSKDKIRVFSFKRCYLLLLLIQWVWANMDIAQHKHKKDSGATNKASFISGR